METRSGRAFQWAWHLVLVTGLVIFTTVASRAAPYAALVMDARSGEVLYSQNADTRLHPASLTKMLTLYIAFEAVKRGEISLDTRVTISKTAAAEPPSRLGLKAGQKIALRHLIRAAAIKSANDAATAIGEAISGSEAAFAQRMNRTARALGMKNSTFKNANGLTEAGHLSTARDMTIVGRRLFYDFPQYYNIFARRTTDAGLAEVANTNRRFLDAYKGADGIKTGYTSAAGFNLTASAERGSKRIIATVFGCTSTAQRNAKMAELLDLGFAEAPARVAVNRPAPPRYDAPAPAEAAAVAAVEGEDMPGSSAKTIRLATAVATSPRPRGRPQAVELAAAAPATAPPAADLPAPELLAQIESGVQEAVAVATAAPAPGPAAAPPRPTEPEVVMRLSTSGGRHWGVNLGRYATRGAAERALLQMGLAETATLRDAQRKVLARGGAYDATFIGLTQDQADLACRRLQARAQNCFTMGP